MCMLLLIFLVGALCCSAFGVLSSPAGVGAAQPFTVDNLHTMSSTRGKNQLFRRKDQNFANLYATKEDSKSLSDHSTWKGGIMCIAGAFIAHMAQGAFYCWGNYMPYSPQHLRYFSGKIDPLGQPDSMMVLPLHMLCSCALMPTAPWLVDRLGASLTTFIGIALCSLGMLLASYATNLWTFLLAYAGLFGAGMGFAYTTPLAASWQWFPKSRGAVTGLILFGYGLGGMVFNIIGSYLANPMKYNMENGVFPDVVYVEGFPRMLRTLAAIFGVISVFSALLIRTPAVSSTTTSSDGDISASKSKDKKSETGTGTIDSKPLNLMAAMRTKVFWKLYLMVILAASSGMNTASIYKQFANTSTVLAADAYQAAVGGVGALFNGLSRPIWGIMIDKLGFRKTFMTLISLQTITQYLYPLTTGSKALFCVSTAASFFCLGGHFAIMPPATGEIFGVKHSASIYTVLYSAFGVASYFGTALFKRIMEKLGYRLSFQILSLVAVLASLICLRVEPAVTDDPSAVLSSSAAAE